MFILVVGSVAYDSVETRAGNRDEALGGSATYFSLASSYSGPVSMIAVVGEDFRSEHLDLFKAHGIDISGIEDGSGRTFRWKGVYDAVDLNSRETLDTQLNVFADFSPKLSMEQRQAPYLFLANIDPGLQMEVLDQMKSQPKLVGLDTMNFWIEGKHNELNHVIESIDVLFMDENEARSFAREANLVRAAKHILSLGPDAVVIKRGEHGVLLFNGDSIFSVPAFPLEEVVDPTGAGDSFAGGFMGYLAATGDLSQEGFRRATVLGSVMGSFTVESFSTDRLCSLTRHEIEGRFRAFTHLSLFSPLGERELLPWRNER